MSKESEEPDFFDCLSPEVRNQYFLFVLAIVLALLGTSGWKPFLLLPMVSVFLNTRKPGFTSFNVFLERWFKEKLFPEVSEKLRIELDERSKRSASIFDSLKDSASSWLLSKTSGIRTELAWSVFSTNTRPSFRNFYILRTASVNLGSPTDPIFALFIGINQEWYLSPHIKLDFDQISVLSLIESSAQGQ